MGISFGCLAVLVLSLGVLLWKVSIKLKQSILDINGMCEFVVLHSRSNERGYYYIFDMIQIGSEFRTELELITSWSYTQKNKDTMMNICCRVPQIYFQKGKILNLESEVARASKLKCTSCGKKGAVLGCYVKSCIRTMCRVHTTSWIADGIV